MKQLHGLIALGGFMGTMLLYAILGMEVSKLNLTVTFLVWIALEGAISGFRKLLMHWLNNRKGADMKLSARL